MRAWSVCAIAVAVAAYGCTERVVHDPDEKTLLPKILLKTAPMPQHPLDTRWEGKLRLLGYDLSEPTPQIGKPFTVTWYWHVAAPLPDGYKIFTHLADGKDNRINLDSKRLLRRIYPESRWKAGDYLKDEQEITLPPDWNSESAVFFLGFYSGDTRLKVTGPQDSENRAEALRLTVRKASAPAPEAPVARLLARHTSGPIKIDGKLDEADWRAAQSTGPFVNSMNGEAGSFGARAQALYDNERLYIAFAVEDDYLKSTFKQTDEHLWEQDTVEVMLDPDGDARNYFELQVSPRGVHFDTRYDSARQPRPFGHVDWDSQVEAKVQLNGKLDDSQPDHGYVVELAIPYRALAVGEPPVAPPTPGATWRVNFYVMDARETGQRAVAWSPPLVGDFHTLDKFGRLVFLEPPAPALQPSAAPATPQPSAAPAAAPKIRAKKAAATQQQ
jgi:hypothetical protein